jgi:hypothetical protein
MVPESGSSNFQTFRDCISTSIIEKLAPDNGQKGGGKKRKVKGRKNEIKPVMRTVEDQEAEAARAAEEVGEFVEVRSNL